MHCDLTDFERYPFVVKTDNECIFSSTGGQFTFTYVLQRQASIFGVLFLFTLCPAQFCFCSRPKASVVTSQRKMQLEVSAKNVAQNVSGSRRGRGDWYRGGRDQSNISLSKLRIRVFCHRQKCEQSYCSDSGSTKVALKYNHGLKFCHTSWTYSSIVVLKWVISFYSSSSIPTRKMARVRTTGHIFKGCAALCLVCPSLF